MTQLFNNKLVYAESDPWDILFRNFFETSSVFVPAIETKTKHPIDIYETDKGLHFDIAVVGCCEEDNIEIEIKDGDTLSVSYKKDECCEEADCECNDERRWIQQGIAKRSFAFGWKIGNKFDLEKIDANVDKGLLSILVPVAPDKKPKQIKINKKK